MIALRRLFWFGLWTILTQLGGIAYLGALALARRRGRRAFMGIFIGLYAGLWGGAMELAPAFGRAPLHCLAHEGAAFAPASPVFCLMNRHYARPETIRLAQALAAHVAAVHPGARTLTLDAGFPFGGFPLMPHLSHKDGRKIDVAFSYEGGGLRSPIGYFAFEAPRPEDPQPCAGRRDILTMRWDLGWLQGLFPERRLDEGAMRSALAWLAAEGPKHGLEKAFLEPHLAARFGADPGLVRFQVCRAARHDDHLHLQTRP